MKRLTVLIIAAVLFGSCKNNNETSLPETKTEVVSAEEETNTVELSAEQMKAVQIETDTVQRRDMTAALKATGVLAVPNQNKALVTSVTNGVIKTLNVQPGDFVRQGQIIATIINPDVAPIQQQLQITNAQINMALIEQARQQELVTGNAAPLKNLQRVNTELATLRATKNGLQQQLRTMGIASSGKSINTIISIPSPISGTISSVSAQIGSNVDASTPIAQIVNNSQLHLDLFIYEKDLSKVKEKQEINFSLTNVQGKSYTAEIYSIGSAFVNETKSIPVHAVVKGDKTGLIDGMNITASISTGTNKVMAVPNEAIVTNNNQDYIFAVKETKKSAPKANDENAIQFEKITVKKGVTNGGYTEIIPVNAFAPNLKIVTKGAFFIMAKMTNKGEEE